MKLNGFYMVVVNGVSSWRKNTLVTGFLLEFLC